VMSEWNESLNAGTYKFMLNVSNRVQFFIGTNSTVIESTSLYNDDTWHHVMVVHDGTTTTLYIDGVAEDSVVTSFTYNLYDFSIGNTSDGDATMHFEGAASVDDVAIYSHELGSVRVAEHYNRFTEKKVYQ